jgi:Dolichyl-phosphate-mannose-protein mannosyltransferase
MSVAREGSLRKEPIGCPLVVFPLAKLVLQLAAIPGYGFFRDEFYYVACSERLDWGYVDHPPLSILLLRVVRSAFGDSIWSIRLPPAVAGALTVLLVGLIARALGGGRFAQSLAMLCAIAAPVYLGLNHFYSMNALDLLLWAATAYVFVRLVERPSPARWLNLGLVLGLGLQNKISVLWLGFGLLVGLGATPFRRELRTPWPWAAAAVAAAVFLPHILWQVANGWPTLEFIRNATQQKMAPVAPTTFVLSQLRMMNWVTAPVWLAGLLWLLMAREGRAFRPLAFVYPTVFAILIASGTSRSGYLAPAYTWLLAAGGVALERSTETTGRAWVRPVALGLVLLGGVLLAPFGLPVLPVEAYVRYGRAMGIVPTTAEKKELAELPQFYADMHGWDRTVETIARIVRSLPAEDQVKAVIFAPNYGVAGAVEFLGRAEGLRAISGHNNYWLWGPEGATGEIVIVVGGDPDDLREIFGRFEQVATTDCGYCMPYENGMPIFLCREPRVDLRALWPTLKHYD